MFVCALISIVFVNAVHRLELKNSIYIRILKRMHQEIEQKLAEQQELSESTTRMNQKFQARDWKLRNVLYRSERNCIERTDRSMEWSQRMFTWSIVAAVGVAVCVTLVLHFVLSFLWRSVCSPCGLMVAHSILATRGVVLWLWVDFTFLF